MLAGSWEIFFALLSLLKRFGGKCPLKCRGMLGPRGLSDSLVKEEIVMEKERPIINTLANDKWRRG